MEEVIGLRGTPGHGSLMEWGVTYRELPLADQGLIDWTALRTAITPSQPLDPCLLPFVMLPPNATEHAFDSMLFTSSIGIISYSFTVLSSSNCCQIAFAAAA